MMKYLMIILAIIIVIAILSSIILNKRITNSTIEGIGKEDFDSEVIYSINEKSITKASLYNETKVAAIEVDKYKIIKTEIKPIRRYEIISKLTDAFGEKGYLFFYSNISYDNSSEYLCAIKDVDQMNILRALKTDGCNYNIYNDDIIKKLDEWNDLYGIVIIGADYDWVEIQFNDYGEHLTELCKEIEEFCPDAIYQGVGSLNALEDSITSTSRVFLWWD